MLKQISLGRPLRGFTLIESMIAVAVSAIMATLSYPSFADQVRKARRMDAIVRLMQVQQAEERWRSNNSAYGTLSSLGLVAQTADALYRLSIADPQTAGYAAIAEAQGAQARDEKCRFMQVIVAGGNTTRASGPDATVANTAATNDRCWLR
jgi:type IV pilus assembly protein PilE